MLKIVLASLFSATMSLPAMAGPFGVDFENFVPHKYGCGHITYNTDGTPADGYLDCISVPKPLVDKGHYPAQIMDDLGLCYMSFVSEDIPDNGYGARVRRKVDEIHKQVAERYGEGQLVDELRDGAKMSSNDVFLEALAFKERTYAYSRVIDPPVDGVAAYSVAAMARSRAPGTGYWVVQFRTINHPECKERERAAKGTNQF